MIQAIFDMIYPVRCPICGEIVTPKGEKVCTPCREKLIYIQEPRCKKCSKPMAQEEREYCSDCDHKKYHFSKGFAVWVYDELMKHSIAEFKYHNKREYAKFYIEEMILGYGEQIHKFCPDVIAPVPLHRSKYRIRGYNQAEILARGIGNELHYPVLPHLLIRNKKTLPQKQLSDRERLRNLKDAFEFNENVANKLGKAIDRVLLVDDIYTTGSTIEACTNVLLSHGVNEVCFIALCIGKGY